MTALRAQPLPRRAITHPAIAALRLAGYDVALCDEASGVALTVWRGGELVAEERGAEAEVLERVGKWLVSRERE